jgi:phage terminase large subunit
MKKRSYMQQAQEPPPLTWEEVIGTWADNPQIFAEDCLGITLTNQQLDAAWLFQHMWDAKYLRTVGKMHRKYDELAHKMGISIHSGHGTGKTRWIATMMLRQLRLFEDIEIRVTAPTFDQIKNNIWKEVSLLARNAKDRWIREGVVIQSDRIFFKSKPEDFITAKTVNAKASEEEQGVALAGAHRTHLLIIVDESAGVPDGVFKPIEGTLTTGVAMVLLIGNPVYSRGYFARTHGVDRSFWAAVRWDDEESNIDEVVPGAALKKYCALMLKKYGRDSNTYRTRVRGLLPTADVDTLIPNDWIMDAVEKELIPHTDSPFIASVDPAAGGQNKSILTIRQGPKVFPLCEYDNNRSEDLADWIGRDLVDYKISQVIVDSIGVGWGIAGGLRRLGYKVREYKSSYAAKNESKFTSARDEDYWHLRELFENGSISIPNDDELIGQLGAIKYKPIMNKTKVESKKDMKSRGIESPDRADSLCMAFSVNDAIYNHKSKEKDAYDEEEKKWGETTWAAA